MDKNVILKDILKLIIIENIKLDNYNLFNNDNIDINTKQCLNRTYLKHLFEVIKNKKLIYNHVIFKLPYFNKLINYIHNKIYFEYLKNINDDNINNNFKILLNNIQFASIHIFKHLKDKLFFDYIYDTHKNNIDAILIKNHNNLCKFIENDVLKFEILNKYINNNIHIDIPLNILINNIMLDINLPKDLIRSIFLKIYKYDVNNINIYDFSNFFDYDIHNKDFY